MARLHLESVANMYRAAFCYVEENCTGAFESTEVPGRYYVFCIPTVPEAPFTYIHTANKYCPSNIQTLTGYTAEACQEECSNNPTCTGYDITNSNWGGAFFVRYMIVKHALVEQ
eukprot:UN23345